MAMESTTNPQEKPWKTNWKRRIIINGLILVGIILLSRVIDNRKQFNRAICYEKKDMESKSFYLKVIDKYNDSLNHNYKTIKYLDLIKMNENKMYIINEIGGFYNSIQIGDTLSKKRGDLRVSNSNRDTTYLLIYNCTVK
jgi:hypothetical protein